MTVIHVCECKLNCQHHPEGKCPRICGDDGVCEDCRKANLVAEMDKAKRPA
jgi:hypothetical protein